MDFADMEVASTRAGLTSIGPHFEQVMLGEFQFPEWPAASRGSEGPHPSDD